MMQSSTVLASGPATEVPSLPALLTVAEVADLLRCSDRSIRRRVKDGLLHPLRPASNRLLFQRAEIEALMSPTLGIPGPALPTSAHATGPSLDAAEIGAIAQDLAGLNH